MTHQMKSQGPTTSIWRERLYRVTIALLAGVAMLLASNSAYSQNPRPYQPRESLAGFAARHVNSATLTRDHSAKTGSFIVFDVPGSACEASFVACTTTAGINDEGTVVGSYSDANQAYHGFLRKADGTFLNIDVPGSTCTTEFSACTTPTAINSAGTVAGYYCDAVNCYGFLRDRDGSVTTFLPTGSVFLFVTAVNSEGAVTGSYCNASGVCSAFVRDHHGNITAFEAPGAVNGTSGASINDQGDIVGLYLDANYASHGFLRDCHGQITQLSPTGAAYVYSASINDQREIVGYYQDAAYNNYGFLRSAWGEYTAVTGFPVAINRCSLIAGQLGEPGEAGTEGFYRDRDGYITNFLPPNALYITVAGLNQHGSITGSFIDSAYLQHGFIWSDR
jgi:hypothetical protein